MHVGVRQLQVLYFFKQSSLEIALRGLREERISGAAQRAHSEPAGDEHGKFSFCD